MREEPQLLSSFRAGDPDALQTVYVRYVERVDTLVHFGFFTKGPPPVRVPGTKDDSRRDIVQEVFLRAFRDSARAAYDGVRPYLPYLLRIAMSVCIDRHRRRARERLHTESELLDLDAVLAERAELPAQSVEEDAHFRSLSASTREFVQDLDEEHQRFVALRFEQELSQADVAERMNVTRRRVRTLEEDVLSGLRKHLAQKKGAR